MKHKVSELDGPLLDAAVAMAEGFPSFWIDPGDDDRDAACVLGPSRAEDSRFDWCPSMEWNQGGPLIEREHITLIGQPGTLWDAYVGIDMMSGEIQSSRAAGEGPTPLIAAMRCFVASKFGEEVDLP